MFSSDLYYIISLTFNIVIYFCCYILLIACFLITYLTLSVYLFIMYIEFNYLIL